MSFAGHDHKYQQYLKNGIHYVITGGGAPLYDVDKPTVGTAQKAVCTDNFVPVSYTHLPTSIGGRRKAIRRQSITLLRSRPR